MIYDMRDLLLKTGLKVFISGGFECFWLFTPLSKLFSTLLSKINFTVLSKVFFTLLSKVLTIKICVLQILFVYLPHYLKQRFVNGE